MTISSSDNRIQYTGNGAASVYSTGTIIFYSSSDLIVTETVIATGVDTVLTEGGGSDYTVTGGSGAAGSITLVGGNLPATKRITIERSIPYTQSSDFVEGEAILAEEVETAFDKSVVLTQQLLDAVNRSVKLPGTTTASSITLPSYSADKLLTWDASTADVIVNSTKTLTDIEGAVDAVAALTAASGVKVSSDDTTVGFLNGKLIAGSGLTFTENNPGGSETLTIDATFDLVNDTTPQLGGTLDTNSKQVRWSKGADVASATALTLGTDGNYFDITGTTNIASIATLAVGTVVKLQFDGILTLTHHATDLILPSGANITTAAGDEAEFVEYAAGDWRCTNYQKASGEAVVSSISSDDITGQTDTAIAVDDEIVFADDSDSDNLKKDTVQGIVDLATGTGSFEEIGDYSLLSPGSSQTRGDTTTAANLSRVKLTTTGATIGTGVNGNTWRLKSDSCGSGEIGLYQRVT